MVYHGGDQGEMPLRIGEAEDTKRLYVYDLTLAEIREHFANTSNYQNCLQEGKVSYTSDNSLYQIATLGEVFDIMDRQVTVNIECKTPRDPVVRPNYNVDRLVRVLN